MKSYMIAFLLAGMIFAAIPAHAQAPGGGNDPLEISADQMLEWNRGAKRYIARGNVIASKGGFEIASDMLTGDYRETKASQTDLYKLTAEGNVIISSGGSQAYGDHAIYDVDTGKVVLTGKDLKLQMPDQKVTALERFEYDTVKGIMNAVGSPKVVRENSTLSSDKLIAYFTKDPAGKNALSRIDANDNVVITTDSETVTGSRGTYEAQTHTATLTGNVKIRRGPNVLTGEKAEVNMATGISRMFGGAGTGGRVRGVFFPGSQTQPAEKAQ